jgi:hypothetical protein
MVQISVEIKGDVDHIRRYREYMERVAKGGDAAAFDAFGKKVLAMYAFFAMRRFDIFSRGGGDWKPLAQSTIKGRKHKGKNNARSPASILRDTGTLFRSLSIGHPANIMRKRGDTFEYGIGGPMEHPGSKSTVGRIAAYHQAGGAVPNRPPQRKILVAPPTTDQVWSEFEKAAKIFLQRIWDESRG